MMKRAVDFSLILPCYNEEPILKESVERILAILKLSRYTYEIIFVDDKSSDKTVSILKTICKKNSNCRLFAHARNTGRGRAVTDGIKAAKGKAAGYIDIDLEVSPIYVSEMVNLILEGKAEVVLGKRIYRTTLASIPREIFSKAYTLLTEKILDTGKVDTESGYKFFNRKKILPLLAKASHPHWFWDTQVIVLSKRAGLKIIEVPVLYLRRFDKKSSVRVARDIMDYLVNLWKFRKEIGK